MKSILMIGPGRGHNIKPFLDYFEANNKDYSLHFLSLDRFEFDKDEYKNIVVTTFVKDIMSLVSMVKVMRKNYDLIWYHGAYHWPISFLVYLLKKRRVKINLNIWSEKLPRSLRLLTPYGIVNRYIVKNSDFIQCNWFGTEQLLKNHSNKLPTKVLPWGFSKEYFKEVNHETLLPITDFFVNTLPKKKYKFFYAKSLTPTNRHDLIIKAVYDLLKKGHRNFIVYFWLSKKTKILENLIKTQIQKLNLEEYVQIVDLPFIPFQDMKHIWSQMDCGLQILEMDQLSISILEPMLVKKDLIASNISSYKFLNKLGNLELSLVENDVEVLSQRMSQKINTPQINNKILQKRKLYVETNFIFDTNIKVMLSYFLVKDEGYK